MDCQRRHRVPALLLRSAPLSHDPAQPLDTGIDRALWLTPAELQAAGERQRSPLVWQVVADYLGGQRHPLSLVREVA